MQVVRVAKDRAQHFSGGFRRDRIDIDIATNFVARFLNEARKNKPSRSHKAFTLREIGIERGRRVLHNNVVVEGCAVARIIPSLRLFERGGRLTHEEREFVERRVGIVLKRFVKPRANLRLHREPARVRAIDDEPFGRGDDPYLRGELGVEERVVIRLAFAARFAHALVLNQACKLVPNAFGRLRVSGKLAVRMALRRARVRIAGESRSEGEEMNVMLPNKTARSLYSCAAAPFGVPVAQRQRDLALQVPHYVRHRVLGRYPLAHVYVLDADAALDDLAAGLALDRLADNPADLGVALPV